MSAAFPPLRRARVGTVAGLLVVMAALGVALLLPRAFSDPVGVDPFSVRLAVVSGALLAVALVSRRLAPSRGVLLAAAAVAVPFTLWAATPRLALLIAGDRLSPNGRVLAADVAYMAATAAAALAARRLLPATERPRLRLLSLRPVAVAAAVAGVLLLVSVGLALPATWLGRLGVQPVALARDMPLLGPAFVLQAAAQELQFRGLLLGVLEGPLSAWAANLGQAVFFGLAHIAVQYEGPAAPFVPVTVLLGLVLGWVTQRTRSLWPAVVVHAAAELAVPIAILPGLYGY